MLAVVKCWWVVKYIFMIVGGGPDRGSAKVGGNVSGGGWRIRTDASPTRPYPRRSREVIAVSGWRLGIQRAPEGHDVVLPLPCGHHAAAAMARTKTT